jgi:hypothetical protein
MVASAASAADAGAGSTARFDQRAALRFPKAAHVVPDAGPEFARSARRYERWVRQDAAAAEHEDVNMDAFEVVVKDVGGRARQPRLLSEGFEFARLNPALLPVLERIRREGLSGARVGPTLAQAQQGSADDETAEEQLARALQGWNTYGVSGAVAINVRCAGFVIRKGGPQGAKLVGSGFDGVAQRVHIDQDLEGEPLLSMGLTWLFESVPFMHIVNVWSPLHRPALRPLAMMDLATLDPRDVLRYRTNSTANAGGRGGSFASDRLMARHSPEQEWWWDPTVDFGSTVLFLTGRTAHSSFSVLDAELTMSQQLALIGELQRALGAAYDGDARRAQLGAACGAARDLWQRGALDGVASSTPPHSLELLRATAEVLASVCEREPGRAVADDAALLQAAQGNLSRSSLEIRCVALVVPDSVFYLGACLCVVIAALALRRLLRAALGSPRKRSDKRD